MAQKYIENPLLVGGRKFDIRQWVLIEDYSPPRVWFYDECYLRFCLQDYATGAGQLQNKFAHLTNNSVQNKGAPRADLEAAMWTQDQFREYLLRTFPDDPAAFQHFVGKLKEIVIATVLATQDQVSARKRSFELIGYDFMVDEELNPWLIEINSSPSMDYSTEVTRRLVKMVLEDTVKVVVDLKDKKVKSKAGLFKCIHKGEAYTPKYYPLHPPP